MSEFADRIDKFFGISKRGSDIKTEVRGGIITFLAMFYILAVNPMILSSAAGPELFGQLVTATCLAACISSLLMGLYAKFPVALAPGMGINAFIAYTIVIAMGFTYYQALLIVLLSGIAFLILAISGIRTKILNAIPLVLKFAITAGIGFFIVIIGLFNSGIIIQAEGSALTLGNLASAGVLLSFLCIIVTLYFWFRGMWSAVLIGVVVSVVVGFLGGQFLGWEAEIGGTSLIPGVGTAEISELVSMPDFGLFGAVFSELQAFDLSLIPAFIASILALLIVDLFDTTGTLVGVGHTAGILDKDGMIEGTEKALEVDAVATVFGAVAGTSTTSCFIESSAGITAGARTGLMAVVVGLLFMVALVFGPIFSVITPACTVGALVIVGLAMIKSVREIDWNEPVYVASAFITIFMMGLSGSITDGIAFGLLSYILGMCATKRAKEMSRILIILGVVFLAYLVMIYWIIPNL